MSSLPLFYLHNISDMFSYPGVSENMRTKTELERSRETGAGVAVERGILSTGISSDGTLWHPWDRRIPIIRIRQENLRRMRNLLSGNSTVKTVSADFFFIVQGCSVQQLKVFRGSICTVAGYNIIHAAFSDHSLLFF